MSDHDLIRRGDAMEIVGDGRLTWAGAADAITALPADDRVAKLVEALRHSAEGWANAIELDLIPSQHLASASILRDEARAAIAAWEAGNG